MNININPALVCFSIVHCIVKNTKASGEVPDIYEAGQ